MLWGSESFEGNFDWQSGGEDVMEEDVVGGVLGMEESLGCQKDSGALVGIEKVEARCERLSDAYLSIYTFSFIKPAINQILETSLPTPYTYSS